MSKYFDTKPGSLEEAVSAAQQAAIAISKKEKGEKPKNEDQGQFAFVAAQAKKNGEKKFTFGGKEYDTETEEVIKEETLDEDTVILDLEDDDKKLMSNIKRMGIKVKKVSNEPGDGYAEYSLTGSKSNLEKANKKLKLVDDDIMNFKETNKNDKSDDGDGLDAVQPKAVKKKFADRKDKDIDNDGDVDDSDKFLHKRRKAVSKAMQGESVIKNVAETVMQMWDEAAKKTESQDMEQDKDGDGMDDDQKAKKTKEKTDSGKDMTPVETSVKMPKPKNEKNKV